LFSAGCGRLFEGTPEQMVRSLSQIRALPDTTRVWCAHEYTLSNLKFAIDVDPDNRDLQARLSEVQTMRRQNQATIPTVLGLEKRTNPFLRWDTPPIQQAMHHRDPVTTFAALRKKKDTF
jgi:hydroxyacylglutathione hydrolase